MALIAIAIVPAMEALQTGMNSSRVHATNAGLHYHLTGKLEELLAEPFEALDQEALAINDPAIPSNLYSDPVSSVNRRLVYLSRYDGDNANPADGDPFTGMDEGLVWIRVSIEGTRLGIERLASAYD